MFHKPVYYGDGYSCFRCCVASMTGENLLVMPQDTKWGDIPSLDWQRWCDTKGYKLRVVKFRPRNKHYIAIYMLENSVSEAHAVVEYNNIMVFNPDETDQALGRRLGYVTVTKARKRG